MRNLILTLAIISSFVITGLSQQDHSFKSNAVQLFSTSIFPYPNEYKIYELVDSNDVYIEPVKIEGKRYYRYLVKCRSIQEARQTLKIVSQTFKDAFIVHYYKDKKRFN